MNTFDKRGLLSGKHIAVDKANSQVIITVSIATAVVVFTIFAGLSLFEKIKYQNKVISERGKANAQLKTNISSTESLVNSYIVFDSSPMSKIGTPDKNSKIVLDALPSKYDFPALTTSIESIVKNAGLTVTAISGQDQEATAIQSSVEPKIVAIPFEVTATGSYDSVQRLIKDFERSIRPFVIKNIRISGAQNGLTVTISAETYYLPARELGIVEKTVTTNANSRAPAKSSGASDQNSEDE